MSGITDASDLVSMFTRARGHMLRTSSSRGMAATPSTRSWSMTAAPMSPISASTPVLRLRLAS